MYLTNPQRNVRIYCSETNQDEILEVGKMDYDNKIQKVVYGDLQKVKAEEGIRTNAK